VAFRKARKNHPGVESAIGAMQAGNGLERCRDKTDRGYERYVGLGILGRNLQTLGKLLLAQDDAQCEAAESRRQDAGCTAPRRQIRPVKRPGGEMPSPPSAATGTL